MSGRLLFLTALLVLGRCFAGTAARGVVHIDLPKATGISSAAFDYRTDVPAASARGVVALVPGYNGRGVDMLRDAAWIAFARKNSLVLGALTFVSDEALLKKEGGYYEAGDKSGQLALGALKRAGLDKLPLVMYGFSGGAHFTASFAEHFPKNLAGWCAASFGEKKKIELASGLGFRAPPGIIACGAEDEQLGHAVDYFFRGRELNRRWTWVEVPKLAHARHPGLEAFVQAWFIAVLSEQKTPAAWGEIGSGENVTDSPDTPKTAKSWLPDASFIPAWSALSSKASAEKGVIEHVVKLPAKDYPQLTMFLRLPKDGEKPQGVLCMCLLANSPAEVKEKIRVGKGVLFDFAEERRLAIVAWGSRSIWDPDKNWNELPRDRARQIDMAFDQVSAGWDQGISWFAKRFGIPETGFLMEGSCGAGQFVQRLALRKPERFLAVHTNIPGSFDAPTKAGRKVLWCLTTGERLDGGYARSLAFFRTVRDLHYPIIYKAYPGVSHMEGSAKSGELGRFCFDYALNEYARATRRSGGKATLPNWEAIFASAAFVGDVKNQNVFGAEDAACIPSEFRMPLPEALRAQWLEE